MATAIGLHFIAVAYELWWVDAQKYEKSGRYVLASGVIIGWLIGSTISFPALIESIIFAFISGAMILNVLNNELPRHRQTDFISFCIGVFLYTSVTMVLNLYFDW